MKKHIIVLLAIVELGSSCEKLTTENIQKHNEGNILFRWELVSYTGPDHVKLTSDEDPCLKDDQIVFYPSRTGKISQGNCLFFQGKDQDINFTWHFSGVSTAILTAKGANGVEASNEAYIDGEGEILTIFESQPYFREYKYRKIPD